MSQSASPGRLPSLDLLRQITDRHVIDHLLQNEELTRAEISSRTGISKPTISESMRRLVSSGLVAESGAQVGRRGRAGTYYRLRDDAGVALAMSAGPDGMIVETCDLRGVVLERLHREVPSPADSATLDPILAAAATAAVRAAPGPVRAWALSLAGPVDQRTGRLVQLPNSPFLLDELDPRRLLGDLVPAVLQVDNDVNWAALAEHHEGGAQDLDHFAYFYLGPGMGAALVSEGAVVHGATGLAGEIAYVRTEGPGGKSMRLIDCFATWGFLRPGSNAMDVPLLMRTLEGGTVKERRQRDAVARAVAGVVCTMTALFNPHGVLIGGPWGSASGFHEQVADLVEGQSAVATEVRPGSLHDDAPLIGVRSEAVRAAQESLTLG